MKITVSRILLALGCTLSVLAGCGSDDAATMDAGPAPDTCLNAGQAETGCVCEGKNHAGSRTCGDDLVWGACACPDNIDPSKCNPGEDLRCSNLCPGETEGRIIQCFANGTYDCNCPGVDAGAQNDATAPDLDSGDELPAEDAGN
jgi:hypothetical protein